MNERIFALTVFMKERFPAVNIFRRRKRKMKKGLTELVFILDRSGSMSGLESDTIGGFNSTIEKQRKEDGEALVSTILFSNDSEVIHDRIDLKEIPKMTEKDYFVGGCTALIDAIGDAVHHIRNVHKYIREEDRPEHTLFMITTDGYENASRKYSSDEVKKMISRQKEEAGWEFIFMGANIDAVETAKRYGIDEDHAVNYIADRQGVQYGQELLCEAVSSVRGGRRIDRKWKEKAEADYKQRKQK